MSGMCRGDAHQWPCTQTAGSGNVFLADLARELAGFLKEPLAEAGGGWGGTGVD